MENIMQNIPMVVSEILLAVLVLTVITNIITQVVKKVTWDKIPTNILAVVVSMAVTLVAFFAACQIMLLDITWYMVAGAVALGLFVAYASMFGYDKLKEASDNIYNALQMDDRVTAVSSSLANTSPIIKIKVDPVQAAAEGLNGAQVAGSLYSMISGTEADTMTVSGTDMSVMVEYPEDEFDELSKVEDIMLTSATGNTVYLKDIADIGFEDSPSSIVRMDKQYQAEISASYTDLADAGTMMDIRNSYVLPNLSIDVTEQQSSQMEMMNEEFSSLGLTLLVAVFLVFGVMAAQFESLRFSGMVMATIPFSMIGALAFLWIFDLEISMVSLMGFLILIGTAVNNGILYVDTVDQKREEMGLDEALVEAGVIRLKPILMTTLTTVIGMVPMAVGTGGSGDMMRGLAMVDIGGLITSTVMALLVLPVIFYYVNGNRDKKKIEID